MIAKKWLVLKTNARAEKMVAERLSKQGFDCYLPIKRTLKQWKDRKKWVDEILIKSHVFVCVEDGLRNKVFETYGVVKFLYVSGKIAVVTEKEIENLKLFCLCDDVKIEKKGLEIGDSFEVIIGPFIGMIGKMNANQNGQTISIYIAQLELFANIKIGLSAVRKIAV